MLINSPFATVIIDLALRKCKKECKIPVFILVQGFCLLKAEIARFPTGFRLKSVLFALFPVRL